jgi:beta-glucosidase
MRHDIGGHRIKRKAALCGMALMLLAAAAPEEQARSLVGQMTQDEKLALVRGNFAALPNKPAAAIGSAGYVPGVPRLGIPALQETDGGMGITNPFDVRPHDTAVALPSGLAVAATFNPDLAYQDGVLLGREAAAKGFNVLLGGGVNLVRDPRGGRSFEYAGEDPFLAGTIVGATIRGAQDQHVAATVKHFAMNDQESARTLYSAAIALDAMRESDLLAFQIAIEAGHPAAVMCAYNKVNGVYACQSPYLLQQVLRREWHFPGWVMSDWGAVHDAAAMTAGLDQESGAQLDSQFFFGNPLQAGLAANRIPQSALDDAVTHILTGMIATGLLDHHDAPRIDVAADTDLARHAEEQAMVLLRNEGNVLPLPKTLFRLAVVGGNADAGVPAGGGSSQVTPTGGYARVLPLGGTGQGAEFKTAVFDPPSPLSRLQAKIPGAHISFADGRYPADAALAASLADAAVVFVTNWSGEDSDLPSLSLPNGQDELIEKVAAANKHTIVVLETAGPVLMPWRDHVAAIVQAWYPGQGGADAIANVLFGDVNPSGHLPVTFPARATDAPRMSVVDMYAPPGTAVPVNFSEGADVGYRWFASNSVAPLYPFGFGLSYTSFTADNLKLTGGDGLTVAFDVKNTGTRPGLAVAQAYLTARGGQPLLRLLGFSKPALAPGETKHVTLQVDKRLLADFMVPGEVWRVPAGDYTVAVAFDAQTLVLHGDAALSEQRFAP